MDGFLTGCDSTFNTQPVNDKSVSAHFGISLAGVVHQYVQLGDQAWANGPLDPGNRWPGPAHVNPNALSVSIETEDRKNAAEPVTDALYQAVQGVCQLVVNRYPGIKYLVAHSAIAPIQKPNCPGGRWLQAQAGQPQSRFDQLAHSLGLEPRV